MVRSFFRGSFFNNRDWPVASAVAVILLVILIVSHCLVSKRNQQRQAEVESMRRGELVQFTFAPPWGLRFLYLRWSCWSSQFPQLKTCHPYGRVFRQNG